MAEQMKPTGKKQPIKHNIAKFRQDRRLLVVGTFRGLGLLIMLGVLVYSIVTYQDYLNPSSLRQGVRYLFATASQSKVTLLDVDSEADAVYLPMGLGMISASKDGFHYHSTVEGNRYHVSGNYHAPALTAGNRLALIYDRGGQELSVVTSCSQVFSTTLDSSILSASMNAGGDFALVTNEAGYRCAVTIYDRHQTMLCKWLSSRYYILTASVSPDAKAFAALCFCFADGAMESQVQLFRVGEESAFATVDVAGRNVCSVKYDNSGNLFILCEDGLLVADQTGKVTLERTFDRPLSGFSHQEGLPPLLVFTRAGDQGELVRLLMVSANGSTYFDEEYSGTYLDAATDGEVVHLLLSDRLLTLLPNTEQVVEYACNGATGVLAGSGNCPILLYSDRGEKLRLLD